MQNQLFIEGHQFLENQEDLIKRGDLILKVLNAMNTPLGRKLTIADIKILLAILEAPAIK